MYMTGLFLDLRGYFLNFVLFVWFLRVISSRGIIFKDFSFNLPISILSFL
jgi:hypothetical protein